MTSFSSLPGWAPWALGGVVLLGVASIGAQRSYVRPKGELQTQISGLTESVRALEKQRDELRAVAGRATKLGQQTLGGKLDLVQHRFRSGLATIAEQQGLKEIAVDCGPPQTPVNPLTAAKGVSPALKREVRAQPGFDVLRGSVKGTGTLEGVLAALASIESQPWVHRVEAFSIKPLGKDRTRYELRAEVATLFAPKWVKTESADGPVIAPTDPSVDQGWRRIVARNPFVKPEARAVAAAAPPPAVVGPTVEDEWKLAGVMSGRAGLEAMFRNARTGAGKTIPAGEEFMGVKLVGEGGKGGPGGAGGAITIEAGGKRFELSIGEPISARRPVGS